MISHIKSCKTAEEAIDLATSKLTDSLQTALDRNKKILLLLSGGSNLKIVDQISKELINNPNIASYVLDERFSKDPSLNNSLQIKEKGVNINLTFPGDQESLLDFTNRFNDELKAWLEKNPEGEIICTLGMGPDGHIAGISPMPDDQDLFEQTFSQNQLVIGYTGDLSPAERVTTSPNFLSKINLFVALILGEAKRPVFNDFISKKTKANLHPVQLLHKFPGETVVFTDL